MKLTGNTVLVTGGGSGIGRGLAEALHKLGNKVIVAGRRKTALEQVVSANPGMDSVELDVAKPESIASATKELIERYPELNVLVNNAGLMLLDDVSKPVDEKVLVSQVETNLLGTIRVTNALIEHLKAQPYAAILNNTSIVAYTPMAFTGVYSATKAGIHAYTMSLRYMLKKSSVEVQEIAPPWVATDLLNSSADPRAMPLASFVEQTIELLGKGEREVLVEAARPFRPGSSEQENAVFEQMNGWFGSEVFKVG